MTDTPQPARRFIVGVIGGGGQLARMMYAAATRLGGVTLRVLAEGPEVSAAQVFHDVTVGGDYTDPATVKRLRPAVM